MALAPPSPCHCNHEGFAFKHESCSPSCCQDPRERTYLSVSVQAVALGFLAHLSSVIYIYRSTTPKPRSFDSRTESDAKYERRHRHCQIRRDIVNAIATMADEVPQTLKQADINLYKTATRGAQLQSVKPIISYWCTFLSEPWSTLDPELVVGRAGAGADRMQANTGWSTKYWQGTSTATMPISSTTLPR